ncbi:SA1362 family protein [Staphylococcus coagulans]|uniref:SA1362 family protein n=1 Tax=Staphylococcus coagulans TaxID=74706 RepID=UPI001FDA8794|nr:SA1362 family protein [Staphylococcus coagulans]MDU9267660.1 hypothetical protein [Staphylococcus coagulans]MDU9279558.1 hypothetical protein [Staphylococcus coagulans]MDU9291602.1 hypothetical protein [Staphylococcus coagulans]MDU9303925.1 hypothetical protein [Staphylococcus coagulans]MDU9320983.1 hypothetical protein [Staphylococcus coagulans]
MQKILFGIVIIIAVIGLVLNLDLVLFGIFKSIIMLIVMIGVIYLIYFFFFLTADQRNYKLRVWKNRYRRRR